MITATVTRPTTISPTLTCDRKIYFVERIDISPLYPPKSRTITLEPVSRRKVAKDQARKLVDTNDRKSRKTDSASRSDPQRNSESTAPSTRTESEPPMSPSPSHVSFESAVSGSNGHSQLDSSSQSQSTSTSAKPLPGKLVNGSTTRSSLASNAAATIHTHPPHALRGHLVLLKQRQHQPQYTAYSAIHLCKQCSPVDLLSQHFNNQSDIIRRSHAETKGHCLVRPCPARRSQDTRCTETSEDARHDGGGRLAQRRWKDQHKQLRACRRHEEQDQTPWRSQGQRVQRCCQPIWSRRTDAFECHRGRRGRQ